MRISRVDLHNFRCHRYLSVGLDDVTGLIGQNSTGKSTVLEAIQASIDGRPLAAEDVCLEAAEGDSVAVDVELVEMSEADVETLGLTSGTESVTIRRAWKEGRGTLLVQRRGLPILDAVRDTSSPVATRRTEYATLRAAHPELGLPEDAPMTRLLPALVEWEEQNPDRCELTWVPSSAGAAISERLAVIRIPAVRETAADMHEGRGTALSALLAVLASDDQSAGPSEKLRQQMQARYEADVAPLQQARVGTLEHDLATELRRFVPAAELRIEVSPVAVTIPVPALAVRAGTGSELTDVPLQGHGFQRALLMAALRLVAETSVRDAAQPSAFLCVDEPELFQHPTMARHMGDVLAQIGTRRDRRVQVAFTTHSPLLIDAHAFERIRVFRREGGRRTVSSASQADVTRLLDALGDGPATRNVARAIDLAFSEAFFASAVILCEGSTDIASIRGAADRARVDLNAHGIVAVAGGKGSLPLRYAILSALGIPAFIVFDGDRNCKPELVEHNKQLNAALQRVCGADPKEFPPTQVGVRHAVFETNMSDYLGKTAGYQKKFNAIAEEAGEVERDDAVQTRRLAVAEFDFPELAQIVQAVVTLATPS